ncbi:NADP-dependent isocitrate dehydrogenase [Pseudonocardia endophytica]|uniref:Isocitrate dehydrogenase [NADP] n=1 Tax=Pseudonocardia endophytica TaxID=401976 RepID=A0A4R1HHU5_PSEEN|nr:NADP-dependent isocitrate dehydrogenase [Pseudonocardia endophytica]TCK21824.1 isocitrate dehydrogenase (NADP) [Pseudonocardia endophytica]
MTATVPLGTLRPVVELRGDEMARVMWDLVRDRIVLPFLDVDLVTFDLSLPERDRTADRITVEAAEAVRDARVGTKCATITPTAERLGTGEVRRLWPSPNGTIRRTLRGVIFREPVVLGAVPRVVPGWTQPIVMARHPYGDQYQAVDFAVPGAGRLTMTYVPDDGGVAVEHEITRFGADGGVALGMHNVTDSIREFARACFAHGLTRGLPVYLSTKDTVLRSYDGAFRDTFRTVFEDEFADRFAAAGLAYEHRLIDDMAASALKSGGGFLWACKNYDGDVQSDVVAQGFGSPGLMTSALLGEGGRVLLTEAAHGTIARHHRRWVAGEDPSTNPTATILAWSRALAQRALLDDAPQVGDFAELVERVTAGAIESGCMTRDLASLVGPHQAHVGTREFVDEVARHVRDELHRTRTRAHADGPAGRAGMVS